MSIKDRRYFLVRTKSELVEKSLVGIGWSKINFSELNDAQEAIAAIKENYKIGRYSNQIKRFFAIKKGDLIVVTLPRAIAIGEATGDMVFDADSKSIDRANQHRVAFPKTADGKLIKIPRSEINEKLQRRLRVQGIVVNDLSEFSEVIDDIYEQSSNGESYSWQLAYEDKQYEAIRDFKNNLLDKIKKGDTNLESGGIGLEHLVRELLEIEGYSAKVMAKTAFSGDADADVKASRTDVFSAVDVNVLVQVKHHQGFTGTKALEQLGNISQDESSDWYGYRLVVCTSANVDEAFRNRAKELNISVLDGVDLSGWIYQHIDSLSAITRKRLGISEVRTLI